MLRDNDALAVERLDCNILILHIKQKASLGLAALHRAARPRRLFVGGELEEASPLVSPNIKIVALVAVFLCCHYFL